MWRISGADPYCLWHGLDREFRPFDPDLWGGTNEPVPPYPSRHRAVLFAFGEYAYETEARLAGAKMPSEKEKQAAEARAARAQET